MSQAPVNGTGSGGGKGKPKRQSSDSLAFLSSLTRSLDGVVPPEGPKGRLGILRLALYSAWNAQLTRMAAALTYRTIFGLIPVLAIGVALLGAFSTEDQVRDNIRRVLHFSGLTEIQVTEPPTGEQAEGDPAAPPPAPVASDGSPATTTKGLDGWIEDIVAKTRGVSYSGIAIIGLLTLAYAAISMLVEVELAFNQIFHAPGARSWGRRLTQYWTLLTLGPVLLFLSFAVGERFIGWVREFASDAATQEWQSALLAAVGFLSTVCISTIMLFVVYIVVPNTRVRLLPALAGAVAAAALWEIGKWGFRGYVAMGGVSKLYGAVALVPLFMFWIYVTWLIVLAGLQLAFSIQMYREVRELGPSVWERFLRPRGSDPAVVDASVSLPLMAVIARRFAGGQPVRAADLGGEFALTETIVLDMLQRLAGAGLLHRVETGEENDRAFALSRPPETISAEEVLLAGDRPWDGADRCPQADLLRRTRDARLAAVRGKTLAEVAAEQPPAPAVDVSSVTQGTA